jgi:hypothetical protein
MFPGVVVHGQKGNRFQLNVINELEDSMMERVVGIICILVYLPIQKLIYPEALAWHFSERLELGGRVNIRYAVPYNSQ